MRRPNGGIMAVNQGGKILRQGADKRPPAAMEDERLATERITVALIPKAAEDLQRVQGLTGLSKTDIVNRAISLYEFIEDQLRQGREVLIRDPEAEETQRVHFF